MTTTLAQWVRDLGTVSLADAATVGGKAANLGELIGAGFPVPAGFALTADSYLESMRRGGVRDQLARLHADALAAGPSELGGLCERMAELVRTAGLPEPLAGEVRAAYAALGEPASDVAVRSSAVGEDASDASFAGMNATFTNVRGAEELLSRIVDCRVRGCSTTGGRRDRPAGVAGARALRLPAGHRVGDGRWPAVAGTGPPDHHPRWWRCP